MDSGHVLLWFILNCLGLPVRVAWGQFEAILAETGFVYERSEGLAEHNSLIRVCQREEIAA